MPRAAIAYPWLAAVGLTLAVLLAIDPSGASAQEQPPSAPEAVGGGSGGVSGGEGGSVGGGDDEQGPPAAPRSAEREAREERQDQSAAGEHKRFGQSRRADPFEFGETAPSTMAVRGPVAAAGSAQDAVICMAGCDGAPGEIVARTRKRGAGSVE